MSKDVLKRKIQKYWSLYPPGLNKPATRVGLESRQFYENMDSRRRRVEPYIEPLLSRLRSAGPNLLEVGCGVGSDLRCLAKLGAEVVGVDLSRSNAQISKRGLKACDLLGEVVVADAEKLPFRSCAFDNAYSFGVLHHTPDTQEAINEIYRVVKNRGGVTIMLYHRGLSYFWIMLRHELFSMRPKLHHEILSKCYDHTPLSKMYTKTEAKTLFSEFSSLVLTVVNFGGIQENRQLKYLWMMFRAFPPLERVLGSFLIIEAKK